MARVSEQHRKRVRALIHVFDVNKPCLAEVFNLALTHVRCVGIKIIVACISSNMNGIRRLKGNKHFKYGLPFVIAIVGGSYGLQFYSQVRYDIQKERHIMTKTKELQKILGPSNQKPKTIEEEYEDYRKKVDLDNWKNIRGPRPWESDNTEYKEMIERRAAESKNQWVFKDILPKSK